MSEGILLFDNGSGGGGTGGNAFDQNAFLDISLPASNNTGFSSTVSRNPLGDFFANDMAPKFSAKELFFRDIVLVQDRAKWISGKPTYECIFQEQFPGVKVYAFGNVQVRGTAETRYLEILDIGGGVNAVGVMANVAWSLKAQISFPPSAPVSLNTFTDGSAGSAISVQSPSINSTNRASFNYNLHVSSNQSYDIHNYQIVTTQVSSVLFQGLMAYFEIPGLGINLYAGNGFVDKAPVQALGSSLAYPLGVSNLLGGMASIFVNGNAVYGYTTSLIPSQSSVAIGSSGTNQIAVTNGTGASFPAGTGVYVVQGTSTFLSYVTSVSTDTLTLGSTLVWGMSATISSVCAVGNSFSISASLFNTAYSVDLSLNKDSLGPTLSHTDVMTVGFVSSVADQRNRFRLYGYSLVGWGYGSSFSTAGSTQLYGQTPPINDIFGIVWGGSTASLQFDGRYSALECEFYCGLTATLRATYVVDGFAYSSFNETVLGPATVKKTILGYGGNGWHQVSFNPAGSTQAILTKITAYSPKSFNAPSFGLLADVSIGQTLIVYNSSTSGITGNALGNLNRIYWDNVYYQNNILPVGVVGAATSPGSVYLASLNANDTMCLRFFGQGFAVRAPAGSGVSGTVLYNGVSTGYSAGMWITLPSPTFIDLRLIAAVGGSFLGVGCVDVLRSDAVVNRQNYYPVSGTSSTVKFFDSATPPITARAGDIWQQSYDSAQSYQYMFGGWQPMGLKNPACFYGMSANLSVPNNTDWPVTFGAKVYDPFNMASNLGTTFTITIPSDGDYLIGAAVGWDNTGPAVGSKFLFISSGAINNGSGGLGVVLSQISGQSIGFAGLVNSGVVLAPNMKKGQIFWPAVNQNAGQTSVITTTSRCYFYCKRIS